MHSFTTVKLEAGLSTSRVEPAVRRIDFTKYRQTSEEEQHEKLKYWLRRGITLLCSQVGIGSIVLSYTVVGASLFVAIESPTESRRLSEVSILRNRIVEDLWNVTWNYNLIHREKWKEEVEQTVVNFQSSIVREIRLGFDGSSDPIWTFPAALMYSLSVYTTIGYGNLTPRTGLGKVMTIFYALFGIPLLLLYMTNIGEILATSLRHFYFSIYRCQRRLEKVRHSKSEFASGNQVREVENSKKLNIWNWRKWGNMMEKRRKERVVIMDTKLADVTEEVEDDSEEGRAIDMAIPISTCLVLFGLYIAIGSVLFSLWEGWNLLDGSYFCFTTLVTLGFGDLVPGDSHETRQLEEVHAELVLCAIYILFGMALMAMCFHLTQERFFTMAQRIGKALHLI